MAYAIKRGLSVLCSHARGLLKTRVTPVSALQRSYARWEPDDIQYEPEIPEYEVLNIQMKGYDYVVLESFIKYVSSLTQNLGLDPTSFASPAATGIVKTYKPFSTNVQSEYNLNIYERTVQLADLPNTMLPILMETIRLNTPEGVDVAVKHVDPEEEDFRYVPDLVLRELRSQLEDIDKAREDRRKK